METSTYVDQVRDAAIGAARTTGYLRLAAIGQTGGVVQVVADEHLEVDGTDSQLRECYADLVWHSALLLGVLGVDADQADAVSGLRTPEDRDTALEVLVARAAAVYRSGDDTLAARAVGLWRAVTDLAEVITGKEWADVVGVG